MTITQLERQKQRFQEGLEHGREIGRAYAKLKCQKEVSQEEIKMFIKMSQKYKSDNSEILRDLQDILEISLEQAAIYLKEYGE